MPTINQYLAYAELSLASYGEILDAGSGTNAAKYRRAGMAEAQSSASTKTGQS